MYREYVVLGLYTLACMASRVELAKKLFKGRGQKRHLDAVLAGQKRRCQETKASPGKPGRKAVTRTGPEGPAPTLPLAALPGTFHPESESPFEALYALLDSAAAVDPRPLGPGESPRWKPLAEHERALKAMVRAGGEASASTAHQVLFEKLSANHAQTRLLALELLDTLFLRSHVINRRKVT